MTILSGDVYQRHACE